MDTGTKSSLVLAALILAVFGLVVYAQRPEERPAFNGYTLPESIGRWSGVEVNFDRERLESWLGTRWMVFREYRNAFGDATVTVYVAYYPNLEASDMAHEPEVCYPGQGWSIRSDTLAPLGLSDGVVQVKRMVIKKGSRHEVVYSWWQTRDRVMASNWSYHLRQVAGRLAGRGTSSLWVRVSAEYRGNVLSTSDGDRVIAEFCSELYPLLKNYFHNDGDST